MASDRSMTTPRVLTIGHSTRTIEDFIDLLRAHGVQLVVDIRTVPRSRRNPQFNEDTLAASLKESGIDYVRLKELGGLRHPRKDSQNTGWRNPSFRGFADYMQTQDFETGHQRADQASTRSYSSNNVRGSSAVAMSSLSRC
jgi:Protein of unknown function, DUF488